MTVRPSVTVMIPTFNRLEDLRRSLEKISKIEYPNLDILIVDDGSDDGEGVISLAIAAGARYLRTPKNIGLIAARNFGFDACKSKYVVNLDDDSWFKEPRGLTQAIDFMEMHPRVAILALNIETVTGADWSDHDVPAAVPYYTGCGNIYRREDVAGCGPYIEEFMRQGEEAERALRVYAKGWIVASAPSIGVFHAQAPANRNSTKAISLEAANYMRRELMRAPGLLLVFGILRALIFAVIRFKRIDWRTYKSAFGGIRVLLRTRRAPVSTASYLAWHSMAWRFHRRRGRESNYLRRYALSGLGGK